MDQIRKLKILNALDLKILAMIFMLCDHLWATIIPGNQWLTSVGRLAFPIFAYQIAEGYLHTHNFSRYLKRLFLFALLSEIPFNLMYNGSIFFPFHQNVLFTFCIALLFIRFADRRKEKGLRSYLPVSILSCVGGFLVGTVTMSDYFGFGVLTVLLFYFSSQFPLTWLWQLVGMLLINGPWMEGLYISLDLFGHTVEISQQFLAVFSLIPIWMYNGKQGPHNKAIQIAGYAFYPVHMLILALLWLYVFN